MNLINQKSKAPTRKVTAATLGASIGALIGKLVAVWVIATFPFLLIVPGAEQQVVEIVQQGIIVLFSGVGALTAGYNFRERGDFERDI